MKIGKIEKRILIALVYPVGGSGVKHLTKELFGSDYYDSTAAASLSRALGALCRKGLVDRQHTYFRGFWWTLTDEGLAKVKTLPVMSLQAKR